MRSGVEREIIAVATQQGGAEVSQNGVCPTVTAAAGMSGNNQPWVCFPETANTLTAKHDGSPQPDKGNGANIVAYSFDSLASNSMKSKNPNSGCREVEVSKTLDTTDPNPSKNQGGIAIVEQHLMDAYQHHGWRKSDVCGTLTAGQNGTVRGDTPLVCAKAYDARGNGDGKTASTITGDHENRITDYTTVLVEGEEETPVYCLQGNGIDRADTAGCNGKGWREDQSYTLNTIDRPAVAYPCNWDGSQTTGTLTANNAGGNQRMPDKENFNAVICHEPQCYRQGGFADYVEGECGTLKAAGGDLGGGSENLVVSKKPRYIVRRLTPTECARLQGFPDTWGHPNHKENLTDEEYRFWLDVRNTHAAINGKQVKEYTREQILKWYNGLHTDSSEYKMWGNGIALPTALYVMQGIAEKLQERE